MFENLTDRLIIHQRICSNIFTDSHDIPTTESATSEIQDSVNQSQSTPNETNNNKDIRENQSSRTAFEHIESIRRGFGVDSGLDSNGQSIVNNYQGMMERCLQKLSNDLYSEQGHFVLELIQNADDNQYSPDCLPTLRFVLSDKRILVCNNEIGFQASNVDAICDVGASTKGKHKQGYAGHKGRQSINMCINMARRFLIFRYRIQIRIHGIQSS